MLKKSRIASYLKEVISEVNKIYWPEKSEVVNLVFVVILVIIIISFILGLFDAVTKNVILFLFS